jgi:hypothetical protein
MVRTQAKFDAVSESRAAYQPKTADPVGVPTTGGPTAEPWWEKTKFNGVSESAAAFTPKPIEGRHDLRVTQNTARQNIKFDGVSESRSQFTAKERALEEAPKDSGPAEKWWEKTKFTGESESHSQFIPKEHERAPPSKDRQGMVRTQAKFDAVSESRAAYQPKTADPVGVPTTSGPTAEPWWEKTKFNGESESHAQYVPKEMEPRSDTRVANTQMKLHRAMVHLEPSIGQVRDSQDSQMM